MARHVLRRCRLDRLLLVPSLQPPHKEVPAASFAHRAAMVRALLETESTEADAVLDLSLIEETLPPPSYSVNMVRSLIAQYGPARYFFIIGADSLLELRTWRQPEELLSLVHCIVVRRDGIPRSAIQAALRVLDSSYLPVAGADGEWRNRAGLTFTYLEDMEMPVSSSAIRAALFQGWTPANLPPAVLAYIKEHRLYSWPLTTA